MSKASFELNSVTRRRLGYELIDLINDYFESLPTRPVQLPIEDRSFESLRESMPESGVLDENAAQSGVNGNSHDKLTTFLRETAQQMIDLGFHVGAANYFGLMNPTPTYAGVLAEALVAALNPQLATTARSQLASKIEAETVRWIGERFGWQQPFDGTFTSGGNEANFSALALALATHFPGTVEDGVASIGAQPVVYASAESHHSLDKSIGLLGLGRKALRRIPLNARYAMDVNALEQAIAADRHAGKRPFCVVATAGTTNSGIIDDIPALADLCERQGLWLHLDGAYGAAVTFSDTRRHLVSGIEHCDSVTIGPAQMAGRSLRCRSRSHAPSPSHAGSIRRKYSLHAKSRRGRAARQLQGVHAMDAPHELAKALAHAEDARTRSLPGLHRQANAVGA